MSNNTMHLDPNLILSPALALSLSPNPRKAIQQEHLDGRDPRWEVRFGLGVMTLTVT